MNITHLKFIAAPPEDQETGLLGFLDFVYDDRFQFTGVALRRTVDQRLTLSYPARRDGGGRQRYFIRPLDDEIRREVEAKVFSVLGLGERSEG